MSGPIDSPLSVALGRVREPVAVTLTRGEWSEVRMALQEAAQKRWSIAGRSTTRDTTSTQYERSALRLTAHAVVIADAANTNDGGQNA